MTVDNRIALRVEGAFYPITINILREEVTGDLAIDDFSTELEWEVEILICRRPTTRATSGRRADRDQIEGMPGEIVSIAAKMDGRAGRVKDALAGE